MGADQALELRPLVGGQSNDVEVVFVDHLHRVHDLGVDIEINKLRLLIVVVVSIAEPFLDLQPVLERDLLEELVDQLKASHLVAMGALLASKTSCCIAVCSSNIILIIMTLVILRHLQVNRIEDVPLHETLAKFSSIFPDDIDELIVVIIECHFRVATPRCFK